MDCPNCGIVIEDGNKCPSCKVDAVLYRRIVRISEKLYNQGLERLHASDLTHGIEALNKSIAIDKNNITARNLLGLALLEIGHTGEAIKHWVISTSQQEENNVANDYLNIVNKNARTLEKHNDAIAMYNIALGHIKQKSDDLAVIQLKRAVENSPRFVDALNLLALCYLIQNEKDRALSMVERALNVDARNPVALNYYSILNPGKGKATRFNATPSQKFTAAPSNNISFKPIGMTDKKSTDFHIAEILSFVIGAVIAAAVVYFLFLPAITRDHEGELARTAQEVVQAEEAHQEAIQAIMEEKSGLETTIIEREAVIQTMQQAAELQDRINSVHQAHWLYQEDQLQDAIAILDNLNTDGLPFDILSRIEAIYEGSYPRLATLYFNEGQAAFNAEDYAKALVDLERTFRFMAEDTSNQWRELLFMLGSLYYRTERFNDALEKLTPLRDNFPNHRPQTVRNMFNSIEEQS